MQKKLFRFDKKVCVGNTLSLDTSSKFLGNFEGILGNPGEIPHIGRKTLGVYRVKTGKNYESQVIYFLNCLKILFLNEFKKVCPKIS